MLQLQKGWKWSPPEGNGPVTPCVLRATLLANQSQGPCPLCTRPLHSSQKVSLLRWWLVSNPTSNLKLYVLSLPTAMLFWEQQDQKRSFGIIYKIFLICPVCSRSTGCQQPKTGTQILFYLSILSHQHSYLLHVLGWIMFPQSSYVEVLTPQYHRMWLYLEIESLQM